MKDGGGKEGVLRPIYGEAVAGRCIRRAATASPTTPTVDEADCSQNIDGDENYEGGSS